MNTEQLRQLRNAFGTYMTGVTVVTTYDADGNARGFTANSFSSVSLQPPLISICIDKSADSFDVFTSAKGYAVNVLAEHQADISSLFASKRADKFEQVDWRKGEASSYPILTECCAYFECSMYQQIDAGDHVMLLGKVEAYDFNDASGLGYARGGYFRLGLEQSAMETAEKEHHVEVGAIVEHQGKVLLLSESNDQHLTIPVSGQSGAPGSLEKLMQRLSEINENIHISSLYAVIENETTEHQMIIYRAEADSDSPSELFHSFDDINWEKIQDKGSKTLLKNYIEESRSKRFGVYFKSAKRSNMPD